jgi:hypothetical protein
MQCTTEPLKVRIQQPRVCIHQEAGGVWQKGQELDEFVDEKKERLDAGVE